MFSLFVKFETVIFVQKFVELGVHCSKNNKENHCLNYVHNADEFASSKKLFRKDQIYLNSYKTKYLKCEKPSIKGANFKLVFPVVIAYACNITSVSFDVVSRVLALLATQNDVCFIEVLVVVIEKDYFWIAAFLCKDDVDHGAPFKYLQQKDIFC
jgi:hypothetical protein